MEGKRSLTTLEFYKLREMKEKMHFISSYERNANEGNNECS